MAKVQTVLGDTTAADLGFTLVHEHLTVGFPAMNGTIPALIARKNSIVQSKSSKRSKTWE